MAQNILTVTQSNPTPPTNMSCTGATPPNPPNYTKNTYNELDNWGTGTNSFPPPYFDDGAAGAVNAYAAKTAALASGTGATAGGTEGSYPGTPNGAVPASTSVDHEELGNVTTVTTTSPNPGPIGQLIMVSDGPVMNTQAFRDAGPNARHASYLGGTATPTISGVSAGGAAGAGTTLLTVTGTNYNRASIVNVDGIPQTTNYASVTSLTVTNAPKRATAGNRAVTVTSNGQTTAPTNWVFS